MHIQIERQLIINAPAEKVWRILAHDFDRISEWASAITKSTAVSHLPTPEGAAVGGRVCANSVPGFGDIEEQFIYYDEDAKRFGYEADGLPFFVTRAENNWAVRSLGPHQCAVDARGALELRWFPGWFLAPLLKWQLGRTAVQTAEELKHFAEKDQPHPRKMQAPNKQ